MGVLYPVISTAIPEGSVFKAVGDVIETILPAGTPAIVFDVNRVPEPIESNYVVMRPLRQGRLSTNRDSFADCRFIGAISGDVLTVSVVDYGSLAVGRRIFSVDMAPGTEITESLSGNSYRVSRPQALSERVMAAGTISIDQHVEMVMQLDVHGPRSADNSVVLSTIFRDAYGTELFQRLAGCGITPLYTDDPRNLAFINGADQYEYRWIVDVHLQINQTLLNIPQEAAESVTVGLIPVDVKYPA